MSKWFIFEIVVERARGRVFVMRFRLPELGARSAVVADADRLVADLEGEIGANLMAVCLRVTMDEEPSPLFPAPFVVLSLSVPPVLLWMRGKLLGLFCGE